MAVFVNRYNEDRYFQNNHNTLPSNGGSKSSAISVSWYRLTHFVESSSNALFVCAKIWKKM
jgi:hypothetical protein